MSEPILLLRDFIDSFETSPLARWHSSAPWELTRQSEAIVRALLGALNAKEFSIANEVAVHQTGHNSGVVHAGIYYAAGSLKARLCTEGKAEIERFAERHDIPLERCGKLIVALSDAEVPALERLRERALRNAVPGLENVGPERIREIEPHAAGVRGSHACGDASRLRPWRKRVRRQGR